MRVWMLDPSFKTPHYDLHLIRALQVQGVEVTLITSEFIHETLAPDPDLQVNYFFFQSLTRWKKFLRRIALARWAARLFVYTWDLLRFWKLLKTNPPDVLHIQWTLFPRLDRIIFRYLAKDIPIVLTIHNPLIRKSLLAKLDDMVAFTDFADQVIVHAEQNREMLMRRSHAPLERVHIVPHGPLFEDIEPVPLWLTRQRFGLTANTPIILFFGAIKPYKGLHSLIAALPIVLKALPDAQLIIAGPPQEPLDSYTQMIADHQLEPHVIFHATFVKNEDVPFYFCASNVVCLPYLEASQSGALLSAYRFGKPVVVTNAGGLPETVEHEQNGLVVPVQDVEAIAQALIRILSDTEMQRAFGIRSQEMAQERFSWNIAAKKTVAIYEMAQTRSNDN